MVAGNRTSTAPHVTCMGCPTGAAAMMGMAAAPGPPGTAQETGRQRKRRKVKEAGEGSKTRGTAQAGVVTLARGLGEDVGVAVAVGGQVVVRVHGVAHQMRLRGARGPGHRLHRHRPPRHGGTGCPRGRHRRRRGGGDVRRDGRRHHHQIVLRGRGTPFLGPTFPPLRPGSLSPAPRQRRGCPTFAVLSLRCHATFRHLTPHSKFNPRGPDRLPKFRNPKQSNPFRRGGP